MRVHVRRPDSAFIILRRASRNRVGDAGVGGHWQHHVEARRAVAHHSRRGGQGDGEQQDVRVRRLLQREDPGHPPHVRPSHRQVDPGRRHPQRCARRRRRRRSATTTGSSSSAAPTGRSTPRTSSAPTTRSSTADRTSGTCRSPDAPPAPASSTAASSSPPEMTPTRRRRRGSATCWAGSDNRPCRCVGDRPHAVLRCRDRPSIATLRRVVFRPPHPHPRSSHERQQGRVDRERGH